MTKQDLETLDFDTILSVGIYKVWRMSAKKLVVLNTQTKQKNYVDDFDVAVDFFTAKAGA